MADKKSGATAPTKRNSGTRSENKSIVLFSDGTGNSSGKLFKTNVWRMYEAVDLGPSPPDKRDQIAYYDNGVGTASFRPLRLLQGAFGWGLKRNVLEIYRYACRNYQPGPGQKPGQEAGDLGDHFYGFGFSRGAFTMRLAIDLIAQEGIVTFNNERELAAKTRQAFRAWQQSPKLGLKALPTQAWRQLRRGLSALRGLFSTAPKYDRSANYRPVIKFIGVWDTVAAYGGPIIEMTRAIDMFVYPLSLSSYKLNPAIGCARHALALDDERDSFQPLLWDEVEEEKLVEDKKVAAGRLEQVWFTGTHADVGGGYPDESLSYVSLLWMMDQAEKADLRTLEVITERYIALANSYGPLHDSRSGLGSYYRYQPRKIEALLEEDTRKARRTLSLRDPSIVRRGRGQRGLLREVKVHESVIARIAYGTDSYAPIVLPGRFSIVPPGGHSEAQPQPVSDSPAGCRRAKLSNVPHAVLEAQYRTRLGRRRVVASLGEEIEQSWNLVWVRRIVYFATVIATIGLVTLPIWADGIDPGGSITKAQENLLPSDDRSWIGNLIRLPTAFLPTFLHGWVEGLARAPYWLIGLIILILMLNSYAKRLERILRDRAGRYWARALGKRTKAPPKKRPGFIARILIPLIDWIEIRTESLRHSGAYQGVLSFIKWYVLPWLIGLAILALMLWLVLAVVTQIALPSMEAREGVLCESAPAQEDVEHRQVNFFTNAPCTPAGGRVTRDETYVVTFQVVGEWKDGGHPTTPIGLNATGIGWSGPFGVPLRRVVNAHYLQPIIAIRGANGVQIHAPTIEELPGDTNEYRMEFTPQIDGELFIFSNDSVLPAGIGLRHTFFYRNNQGEACVTIRRTGTTAPIQTAAVDNQPCGKPSAPRRPKPRRQRRPAAPPR